MKRSVLTAGLLSIAALGLGIVSAQAAPSASQLSGVTSQTGSNVEKTHWRRDWRWNRHHRHYRHKPYRHNHYYRRWW